MQSEPESLQQLARRPLLVDSLLAVLYATTGLILGRETPLAWHPLGVVGSVLTVLVSAALAARRLAPVAVLAAVVVLWIGYVACGYWPVVNAPAVLLALYTVAAARGTRTAALCAAAVGGCWLLGGLLGGEFASMRPVLIQAAVFPLGIVYLGRTAGLAAERSRRLAELTRQLRAEQELRAQQAVTGERVRIARELHDVVAHHMSMVSLQAGMASYVFDSDPATARGALETIAATSREALGELRRMLVLLRTGPELTAGSDDPDAGLEPAPGLGRLEDLLGRVRAAGVPVELLVTGEAFPLPPGMDLCAYRVVQESLTNVVKHAGPSEATVSLDYGPRALVVRIADTGGGRVSAVSAPGAGHGLIGMHERAKIYRGTVSAGPRAQGGFQVVLTLPAPDAGGTPHSHQFP